MKIDILDLFAAVDKLYPEGDKFSTLMEEESAQIYELYTSRYSDDIGHRKFMDSVGVVGTKAWYRENPKSYTSIDMKGSYFLTRGFILGVVDKTVARKILNKHLKKHNGRK